MALFWQISGPESHLRRDWKEGKSAGNGKTAEAIFEALSVKSETGAYSLDLIMGKRAAGTCSILLPYHWRGICKYLDWTSKDAYHSSRFASLSPIHIDTPLRLQTLLEERQKVSKATKASKHKGDNSRLNGRFWDSPPNPSRAMFENNRCLWRIIRNEFHPPAYGLPEAPWRKHVIIFSLVLNFWAPDGIHAIPKLIDAGLTMQASEHNKEAMGPTWYFVAKENQGLQNSFQAESTVVRDTWCAKTLIQEDIGREIQIILDAKSQSTKDSPISSVLLVHDYSRVKEHLAYLGGLKFHQWAFGVSELLNFHKDCRQFKQDPYAPSSRKRSCSPRGPRSSSISLKREESPYLQQVQSRVYVVDTLEMFKIATESGVHMCKIRPVTVFNKIAGRNEDDPFCAGDDSYYILQSWIRMVQGPSVDEQRAFFGENEVSTSSWLTKDEPSDIQTLDTELPEANGLFKEQPEVCIDVFNDGSDTESDEGWYSITRA